jgi:hypothetical protein
MVIGALTVQSRMIPATPKTQSATQIDIDCDVFEELLIDSAKTSNPNDHKR